MHIATINALLAVETQYRAIALLGAGGEGTLYKAIEKSTSRNVALKLYHQDADNRAENAARLNRCDREAQFCQACAHPNIVKMLNRGRLSDGHWYSVFEWVEGVTLRDGLRTGNVSANQAALLMTQSLNVLACIHERGFIYGDFKPSNLMIASCKEIPQIKLVDFGAVDFVEYPQCRESSRDAKPTRPLLTPCYCAPELLQNKPPIPASDLYAWGLVMLECLTGRPVLQGFTVAEIRHRQLLSSSIPLPSGVQPHPLGNILARVLRQNAAERPKNSRLLYAELCALRWDNFDYESLRNPFRSRSVDEGDWCEEVTQELIAS